MRADWRTRRFERPQWILVFLTETMSHRYQYTSEAGYIPWELSVEFWVVMGTTYGQPRHQWYCCSGGLGHDDDSPCRRPRAPALQGKGCRRRRSPWRSPSGTHRTPIFRWCRTGQWAGTEKRNLDSRGKPKGSFVTTAHTNDGRARGGWGNIHNYSSDSDMAYT